MFVDKHLDSRSSAIIRQNVLMSMLRWIQSEQVRWGPFAQKRPISGADAGFGRKAPNTLWEGGGGTNALFVKLANEFFGDWISGTALTPEVKAAEAEVKQSDRSASVLSATGQGLAPSSLRSDISSFTHLLVTNDCKPT